MKEINNNMAKEVTGGNAQGAKKAVIDQDKCLLCSNCADACPVQAIYWDGNNYYVNSAKCTGCGECVNGCPTVAIKLG